MIYQEGTTGSVEFSQKTSAEEKLHEPEVCGKALH